jgi:Fe-S-cluster containining protein
MKDIRDDLINQSLKLAKESTIPFDIGNSPNPLALLKWYRECIKWATQNIDNVEKYCGARCTCSCGCNFCCKQAIAVSSTEMLMIKKYIFNFDKTTKNSIYKKCVTINKTLSANELTDDMLMKKPFEKYEKLVQEKYFSLNLDCPLLGDNGACLIYEIRPDLCWSYRSYGDPQLCATSYDVDTTVKYDDWEGIVLNKLVNIKRPDRTGLMFLPNALKKVFEEV